MDYNELRTTLNERVAKYREIERNLITRIKALNEEMMMKNRDLAVVQGAIQAVVDVLGSLPKEGEDGKDGE